MSDRVRRFFNLATVAIGGLIVALAGPCTVFFAGGALAELASGNADAGLAGFILVTALVVGGTPLAAGLVLLLVGLRALQAGPRR